VPTFPFSLTGSKSKDERGEKNLGSCPCKALLAAANQVSEDLSWSAKDVRAFMRWRSGTDSISNSQKPTTPSPIPAKDDSSAFKSRSVPLADSADSPPDEPSIASHPMVCDALIEGRPVRGLIDSGAQADVLSADIALSLGLDLHRLIAPVHAELGVDGHTVRLALYSHARFQSGTIDLLPAPSSSDGYPPESISCWDFLGCATVAYPSAPTRSSLHRTDHIFQ
jgi:hypothetical protein